MAEAIDPLESRSIATIHRPDLEITMDTLNRDLIVRVLRDFVSERRHHQRQQAFDLAMTSSRRLFGRGLHVVACQLEEECDQVVEEC